MAIDFNFDHVEASIRGRAEKVLREFLAALPESERANVYWCKSGDGSAWFEWINSHCRIGVVVDFVSDGSGWYVVSRITDLHEYGDLDTLDMNRVAGWIEDHRLPKSS